MELLDRYLQAVKFWLPKSQQDDIVAELSEDIRSQIEEKEGAFGRTLTQPEVEAILKQRGRPLLVANQYLPQRSLIGPVLFPIYKFVLKIVGLCYLVPWVMVWISFLSFDSHYRATHSAWHDLFNAWGSIWFTALTAVGTVTVVFALVERAQAKSKFLEKWDPNKLPPVRDTKQIPRYASVMGIAANVVFLTWWLNGKWALTIFDHSGVRIVLMSTWQTIFCAIALLSLATIVKFTVDFFRPQWTPLRAGIQLALDAIGAGVFCWFLRARILAEIIAPNVSATRAAEITNAINTQMSRAFPLAIIVFAVILGLVDVSRILRLRSRGSHPAQDLGRQAQPMI
jgi:hypothetical protein